MSNSCKHNWSVNCEFHSMAHHLYKLDLGTHITSYQWNHIRHPKNIHHTTIWIS